MKITLIRHGEIAGDPFIKPEPGVSGCLSERGDKQAEATRDALKDWDFTDAYSSPYGRALQTAETVMQAHNIDITILDFMHEWMPDRSLENIPSTKAEDIQKQVAERYPHDMWKTELGEGTLDMFQRIGPPFLEMLRQHGVTMRHGAYHIEEQAREKHIVVFAHGGSHGTLLTFLLQIPISNYGRFSFDLSGVATLQFNETKDHIYYPVIKLPNLHGI